MLNLQSTVCSTRKDVKLQSDYICSNTVMKIEMGTCQVQYIALIAGACLV